MPKILITNNYDHSVKSIIEKQKPEGFELVYLKTPGKESLLEVCNQVDYFLVGGRLPIDSEVLMKASGLKMIQRTGVGLDQVDLEYLKKKGIPLYVNKGVNAISVAE